MQSAEQSEKMIFEITDKTGRKIHLAPERWKHIISHRYMASKLDDIKKALVNPSLIVPTRFDEKIKNYYLHYKDKKRYLLVGVKYLNGKGFITTAFIARKIIRR